MKSKALTRRDFLRLSGGALGISLTYLLWRPRPVAAGVRPPGALPAADFEAACLRCGRCAAACERQAIRLSLDGLPYIDGLGGWCDFCMLCGETCPAAALQAVDPASATIGAAVIDRERCIAWNWLGCRLCAEACADLQGAIWLDDDLRPHVDSDRCNGCGACVYVCPQSAAEGRHRRYGKAVALQSPNKG